MNSLPNMEAAEKIVYMEIMDYNEKWSTRVIRGFGDEGTKQKLKEMFEERYATRVETSKADAQEVLSQPA